MLRQRAVDVAGFKRGKLTLSPIEREELGDVTGRSLLHLQCHFGLDTMSWARLGANVTGALAVAWEDAGGARAAAFSQVPYLEIRGVSDHAAAIWKDNLPLAMTNVATVLDKIIGSVLAPGGEENKSDDCKHANK